MKRLMKNSITPNWTRVLLISTLFAFHTGEVAADRAYPFHDSNCLENNGYNICYANQGVFQETKTPSGNTTYMGNGSSSYTEIDPTGKIVYQDTLRYHTQGLNMQDVMAEYGQKSRMTLMTGNTTCTINYAYHFANGTIQFERNNSCT